MPRPSRLVLDRWVLDALTSLGGRAGIVDICKWVWDHHERDLRSSGDLFYTWQYDIRWAADRLRRERKLKAASLSPQGVWELSP
jgi:hypothetical protein